MGALASALARVRSGATITRATVDVLERPEHLPVTATVLAWWGPGVVGSAASAAARYPDVDAVVDPFGAISYRRLWEESGCMAVGLVRAGAGPGTTVGLLGRNHRGFVVAFLAACRTGADIVLLNTEFAAPQLAGVVGDEGIEVVVHDDEFAGVVAAAVGAGGARPIGEAAQAALRRSAEPPPPPRHAGRIVLLTSGTTGRPKGAGRSSGPTAPDAVAAVLGRIPLRVRDTQVIAAPLFHGWGLTHLLLGFARAATTALCGRFDPETVLRTVAGREARVLVAVPVMLSRILALGPAALVAADTSRLRVIASGGSAIDPATVVEVLDRFGPVLYNTYGSTEVALATVAGPTELRTDPRTAGRPLAGVEVAILDDEGARVGPGERGRIFVGSALGFDGYTDGATKERIDGLLSSGDVGRLEGGLLVVDGRADDMVVSGGENVFPAEVEHLLGAHPDVVEAAVVGVPDDEFGAVLAAYVVRREGAALDEEAVRRHVAAHLARFKTPRTVRFLAALPRTATGKVITRELP